MKKINVMSIHVMKIKIQISIRSRVKISKENYEKLPTILNPRFYG